MVNPAPLLAQRLNIDVGVDISGVASSNPDLAPKGQEESDAWLEISPYFSLSGTVGERITLSGSGSLGATARLSAREGTSYSGWLRPSGNLLGTLEVVDNFFYIDARAIAVSELNDPFQATTSTTSPYNTSTDYQVGLTPYVRGRFLGTFNYEVRSDNSWSDSPNYPGQYSGKHSVNIERAPQPFGGAFNLTRTTVDSSVEGQSLLTSDTARVSLRYAPTSYLAFGARIGAERYNYTLSANDWQRYYGAEISWKPNERTSLEGYWEDRVFGNSWQLAFSHRRPLAAFNISSSRVLSTTPEQFLTYPGLSNIASLLNAAFTTRIPDPIERQRAVNDFLARSNLPSELLTPTIIYSEGFTIEERNTASAVFYGERNSLTFTVYSTITEGIPGISSALPVTSKTLQRGTEVAFSRRLTPVTGMTATASWRNTEDQLETNRQTTQKELLLELTRRLVRDMDLKVGARYQWVDSTVTNDATEAALYFTLNYRFD